MDMINTLWQMGVLSVVLIFGIKIGLAMGFANLSKKIAALITIGYGVGVILLTSLASTYISSIQGFFTEYSSLITIIMALVIMYAGFHTIKEWKQEKNDHASATCMAMIAPCPCCFGAVLAVIVTVSPIIGMAASTIGYWSGIALMIMIAIFYLTSGLIVKFINKPYPVLLGNFMLFAGLYFLASAIILPNISSVLQNQMAQMSVPPLTTLLIILVVVAGLIGLGVFIQKRGTNSLTS